MKKVRILSLIILVAMLAMTLAPLFQPSGG
jgi:hypothetical protein